MNIVYEDDDLLVVNKPAGLVVHPGHGNYTGTLVNALAYYLKDDPYYDPSDPRLGLVHRIDKDTSGLLVVAKHPEAKSNLSLQFFNTLFNDERYGGHDILKGTTFTKYKQFVQNCFAICPRQALHAKTLGFVHPTTGEEMFFDSEIPSDMQQLIDRWRVYANTKEL